MRPDDDQDLPATTTTSSRCSRSFRERRQFLATTPTGRSNDSNTTVSFALATVVCHWPLAAAAALVVFVLGAAAGVSYTRRNSLEELLARRDSPSPMRVLLLQRAGSAYVRAAQSYADATSKVDSNAVEVASRVLLGAHTPWRGTVSTPVSRRGSLCAATGLGDAHVAGSKTRDLVLTMRTASRFRKHDSIAFLLARDTGRGTRQWRCSLPVRAPRSASSATNAPIAGSVGPKGLRPSTRSLPSRLCSRRVREAESSPATSWRR